MNDTTTITIEPETKASIALAIIPAASLPTLIAADTTDILGKLRAELSGYTPDASTEPGRKEIGQKSRRIGVAKMDFKRLKEGLLEDAKKQVASVNAEYKVIETNCDALRDAIDGVLEAYKQIERDRVTGHEAALAALKARDLFTSDITSAEIAKILADVRVPDVRDWQEFAGRADTIRASVIATLEHRHAAAVKREAEAAELARLREAEAERQRLAAIQAQKEREEQIARDAARAARLVAEARAELEAEEAAARAREAQEASERQAQAERDAAARREREAAEALAQAERDKQEAEKRAQQLAAEAEAIRVKGHRDALEALNEATNVIPGTPPAIIRTTLRAFLNRPERDWQEFSQEAADLMVSGEKHIQACVASAEKREADKAEADRVAAIERERIAADRAEINRLAEVAATERKLAAQLASERQRVADEHAAEQAEADHRAANVAHRKRINNEILLGMVEAMSEFHSGNQEEARKIGMAIIFAIVKGGVPHTTINY